MAYFVERYRAAVKKGDVRAVKAMLNQGFDLATDFKKCWTALHLACKAGQLEIARLLIENGADLNAETSLRRTPLDEAIHYKQDAIADLLRVAGGKHGYDLSLASAITAGNLKMVKQHIKAGADINKKVDGELPLCVAFERRQWAIAEYLLKLKPDVTKTQGRGETPLHVAVSVRADQFFLKALLRLRAEINAVDDDGQSPLARAAEDENEELVQFLVDRGANVRCGDPGYSSPVAAALRQQNYELARRLIDTGAEATLHEAAECGHLECVQKHARAGAKLEATNGYPAHNPLQLAVSGEHHDVAEFLLESKADPNAQEESRWGGDTLLHTAVRRGSARLVKILLGHGADPDLQNSERLSALEFAKRHGHSHLVSVMEAHLDKKRCDRAVEQLFTIHRVAELLSVDEPFVRDLISKGKIRQLKLDEETIRVPESSLGRYLSTLGS